MQAAEIMQAVMELSVMCVGLRRFSFLLLATAVTVSRSRRRKTRRKTRKLQNTFSCRQH